jgi:hypothetical protein
MGFLPSTAFGDTEAGEFAKTKRRLGNEAFFFSKAYVTKNDPLAALEAPHVRLQMLLDRDPIVPAGLAPKRANFPQPASGGDRHRRALQFA